MGFVAVAGDGGLDVLGVEAGGRVVVVHGEYSVSVDAVERVKIAD